MKTPTKGADIKRPALTGEILDARQKFRSLILADPNYFGNMPKLDTQPKLKIISNTSYEEIGSVGYQPQFKRLHAVVFVKQTGGYGGGICQAGTPEYVRFYLSFDGGATWADQGVTSFDAHDVAENKTRLEYAVTLKIDPPRPFCFNPSIIQCRAILSWNFMPPPNDPDFQPVWGEVHNTNITVEPRKFIIFKELIEAAKIKLPPQFTHILDHAQELKTIAHAPHSAAELHKMYDGTDVEPHRFALKEMQAFIKDNVSFTGSTFLDIGIDWAKYVDFLQPTDGNVSYEELEAVGYDHNTETLAGVIRVKKPNGYSGPPCSDGSTEYVTFWADTNNNGIFDTYLGTAAVKVHDYDKMPEQGLEYSVFLPVDLAKYRKPCKEGPRIIPIRAILSWQVAAPANNPDYVPVWGNREETNVLIEPGSVIPEGQAYPVVSSVGKMPTPKIDGAGYANGTHLLGFEARMSPFGGRVDIAGKIINGAPGSKYRIMVKPHGAPDSAYVPLVNEPDGLTQSVTTPPSVFPADVVVHADAQGYYDYLDYGPQFVDGNILMKWFTGAAENGKTYDLRLDLSVDGIPAHDIKSAVTVIRIDNQAPVADLAFTMGMGVLCSKGSPGIILSGVFTAQDEHFHSYSFAIYPNDVSLNVQLPVPSSGVSDKYLLGGIADPGVTGQAFTLNTAGMAPCGYALILRVYDRTIVNSAFIGNYAEDSVGFCLA